MSRSWREYVKRIWIQEKKVIEKVLQKLEGDTRLDKDQLKRLITKWEDPATQAMSEINKRNRTAKILNHKSGTRAIADIREDLRKENQKDSTSLDVMKVLYPSETIVDDMQQAIAESKKTHDGSEGSQMCALTEKDAYQQVMQPTRKTYIRNVGVGHDKSSRPSFSPRLADPKESELQKEVQELKQQIREMKEERSARFNFNNLLSFLQQFNGNANQIASSGSATGSGTVGEVTRSVNFPPNFPSNFPHQLPFNPYFFHPQQMTFPVQGEDK